MKSTSDISSYLKRFVSILAVGSLLVFWQNCSEVGFSNLPAEVASKSEADGDFDESREGSERELPDKDDIINDDEVKLPDIPSDPDGVVGETDRDFLDSSCAQRISGDLAELEISPDAEDRVVSEQRGPLVIEEAAQLTVEDSAGTLVIEKADSVTRLTHVRGPASVKANSLLEMTNIRGPMQASALEVGIARDLRGPLLLEAGTVAELSNHRGPVCLSASDMGPIFNLRGPLRILGASLPDQKAQIDSVTDSRGPLQIVDADIEEIVNHRGPIILVNSKVGRIENARGPVILVDGSEVQDVVDHRGPLVQK